MDELLDIEAARGMRKLTLEQLAESVGTTKSTLLSYESGKTQPTPDLAALIAKKLQVPRLLIGNAVVMPAPKIDISPT